MSRQGNCYDSAAMESFWSSFKRASIDSIDPTREDGTTAAFDSIETFSNRVRLHSALGYQSPVDIENPLNEQLQPPPRVSIKPRQAHLSVRRAKGLDFFGIILVDFPQFEKISEGQDKRDFFMGASRARQLLAVLHMESDHSGKNVEP